MKKLDDQHGIALISIIEMVLMGKGNTKYNLLATKLSSQYDCTIRDCYQHPEYLKSTLKEVYNDDYNPILDDIKLHLGDLANEEDIATFFKIMEG